ncbi:MAG: hypothetical protein FWH37_09845 [Candidatus Bathyarchaeota archaeon]|nr:hypothetical protein [Candidatus Termiticorpusculum sp.]
MVRKLAKILKMPLLQCPLEVFTYGNDVYPYVLSLFLIGFVGYGLLVMVRGMGVWLVREVLLFVVSFSIRP